MSLRDYPYVPEHDSERPSMIVCVCYGCKYMTASPMMCTHPQSQTVMWDVVRKFTYKMPSIEMCCRSGNRCSYFTPDRARGMEYEPKSKEKAEKDKKVKDLIKAVRESHILKDKKDEEEKETEE